MTKALYKSPAAKEKVARSKSFNIDNGAAATIDDCLIRFDKAITLRKAQIVYNDATTGTVAAGNARIGTTVGGSEIVASTAYENTKAVGTITAMTLVSEAIKDVAANTPLFVRHTGVAVTQAGEAIVELYYTVDDE